MASKIGVISYGRNMGKTALHTQPSGIVHDNKVRLGLFQIPGPVPSKMVCFSRNYHITAVELHFTAKPEEQPYASIT